MGAGIGAGIGGIAGFLADLFGGGDPSWAPSDSTLDTLFGTAWQDILRRRTGAGDSADELWGSLGGFIPTNGPLDSIIESILMTNASRDINPLIGMGAQASANRAGTAGPPPSEGIGSFTNSLLESIYGPQQFAPTRTSSIFDTFLDRISSWGSGGGNTNTTTSPNRGDLPGPRGG